MKNQEQILPVQEEVINKLVAQGEKMLRGVLERVARGDLSAESAKEEIIAEIDSLLDKPFEHNQD